MRLSRRRTELALKVPTCMMQWMLPRIMRFQAEHPELQVQITTTWDHQVDFRMEPFDAAVIYAAGAGPDMHAIPLFDERLTPVCAPSLPARQPLASLDDLAGHTLLHPTRDHRDWKRWLDHAGAPHVDSTRGELRNAGSRDARGDRRLRRRDRRPDARGRKRGGAPAGDAVRHRCRRGWAITSCIRTVRNSSRRSSCSAAGSPTNAGRVGRRACPP